jgi:SAM-dependent methyltransferase
VARIDWDAVSADYPAGRGLSEDGLAAWRTAITPYLRGLNLPLVDVGSGAGQFAPLFADWFAIEVIGVEPSTGMRAQAEQSAAHPRVRYVAGEAERLPLPDASCGAAWISTVIHHVPNLAAAAMEVWRVLAEEAPVLIRSAFPGRTERISLFEFFPEAAAVVETYPTIEQTCAAFEAAGFRFRELQSVPQVSIPNLAAMRPRAALRADTTLQRISDASFEAGLARLDAAMAAGRGDERPADYLDLLVFD